MTHSTINPYFPENLDDYAPWVAKHGLRAPYGKCQCGCGQDAPIARATRAMSGVKKNQPFRYIRSHNRVTRYATVELPYSVEMRFWSKVDKHAAHGCWEWMGTTAGSGYGYFWDGEKSCYAHRFSYELHNGQIGEELHACHSCDNPRCVNPNHIFLGSRQENMEDMVRKNRHGVVSMPGELNPSAVLTEKIVRQCREEYAKGETISALANRFGVNWRTMMLAITGQTWRTI